MYLKANQTALDIGESIRKTHYDDKTSYKGICHTGGRSLSVKIFAADGLAGQIRRYGRQEISKASMDVDTGGSLRRSVRVCVCRD